MYYLCIVKITQRNTIQSVGVRRTIAFANDFDHMID